MRRVRLMLALSAAISATAAAAAPGLSADPVARADAPLDPLRPLAAELAGSAAGDLVVALAGSIGGADPGGALSALDARLAGLLAGGPGERVVSFAGLETSLFDDARFAGHPYPWNDAPTPHVPAATASALRAAGFDLLARANDHALDWGIEGMRATADALDAAGLAGAGAGETLGLARRAAYFDEPGGGGRIALVSVALTYRPTSEAVAPRGAAPGRPGVSAVEVATAYPIAPAELAELARIACRFRDAAAPQACAAQPAPAGEMTALGSTFVRAEAGEPVHCPRRQLDARQAEDVLRAVRAGKQGSDLLVAWIHADHVQAAAGCPGAAFPNQFAHAAIDAGADMVVATGRPEIGAIEIYRAAQGPPRPIFHGLGEFLGASASTAGPGFIARVRHSRAGLIVDLHPLAAAGSPRLAGRAAAIATIDRLRRLSSRYGTLIDRVPYRGTAMGRIIVPLRPAP